MKVLEKFWRSIKRNPVINVMLAGILIEAANHAIATGDFDVKDFCFYAFQLALAAIAREFVVPLSEHNVVKDKVSEAIVEAALREYRKGIVKRVERENLD